MDGEAERDVHAEALGSEAGVCCLESPFLEAWPSRSARSKEEPVRPKLICKTHAVAGVNGNAGVAVPRTEEKDEVNEAEIDKVEGDMENEEETGRTAKMNNEVYKPSKIEIRQHERLHCPFRPWCRHCVRGRAANAQHRKERMDDDDDAPKVPRVAMDYLFMFFLYKTSVN